MPVEEQPEIFKPPTPLPFKVTLPPMYTPGADLALPTRLTLPVPLPATVNKVGDCVEMEELAVLLPTLTPLLVMMLLVVVVELAIRMPGPLLAAAAVVPLIASVAPDATLKLKVPIREVPAVPLEVPFKTTVPPLTPTTKLLVGRFWVAVVVVLLIVVLLLLRRLDTVTVSMSEALLLFSEVVAVDVVVLPTLLVLLELVVPRLAPAPSAKPTPWLLVPVIFKRLPALD